MKQKIKTILAGLSASLIILTSPMLNAYQLNPPKLLVKSEKRDIHINFSKDGSKFVYSKVGCNEHNKAISSIVVNEKGIEKEITDMTYFDSQPSFSPDGKKIAFFRYITMGLGSVYVMDSDGKNLEEIISTVGTKTSWSSDGKEILSTGIYIETVGKQKKSYGAIVSIDLETKEMRYLTTNEGNCGNPELTADGRILYTFKKEDASGFAGRSIWIMDQDGKNKECLVESRIKEKRVQNDDGSLTINYREESAPFFSSDDDLMVYLLDVKNTVLKGVPKHNPFDKRVFYEYETVKKSYPSEIYVRNLKTGETKLVTDEGNLWFPEIKNGKVYFSRYDDFETEHNIYSIDLK